MIQTMFTYWNFIVSGNRIIATPTIPTVDLVSVITTRSKRSEKGQKSGTNRWRRIYRISFLDLSSCPSGASHFTFEFIRTGHRNLLFDRSPSSPLLFSNPGSTGPLLLPQRPRYFVVVSSSMPPFFVSCSPFVSFFDSLSLSSTPILSSQFHLVSFVYIFLLRLLHFYLILQFLYIFLFYRNDNVCNMQFCEITVIIAVPLLLPQLFILLFCKVQIYIG